MVIYVIECKGQNLMWVEKLGFWCRFKKPFGHTWASAVIRHCESMSRGHSAHDPAGLAFKAVVDERPDIKVSQLDEEPNMFRGPK